MSRQLIYFSCKKCDTTCILDVTEVPLRHRCAHVEFVFPYAPRIEQDELKEPKP